MNRHFQVLEMSTFDVNRREHPSSSIAGRFNRPLISASHWTREITIGEGDGTTLAAVINGIDFILTKICFYCTDSQLIDWFQHEWDRPLSLFIDFLAWVLKNAIIFSLERIFLCDKCHLGNEFGFKLCLSTILLIDSKKEIYFLNCSQLLWFLSFKTTSPYDILL
jgi:hypothetical protein